MPCECEEMSDKITVMVKAIFVGFDENGKLMKRAPGNYKSGQIVELPYHEVLDNPWWEALEAPPELTVPPPSEEDSVFVAPVKLPFNDPDLTGMEDRVIDVTPPYKPEKLGDMVKRELVDYVKERGGEADMSMKRDELLEKAREASKKV